MSFAGRIRLGLAVLALAQCAFARLASARSASTQSASTQGVAGFSETTTADGLRIWSFPDDGGDRFVLLVLVGTGSRDETDSEAGIAHYLEHVVLASSARASKRELDLAADEHGAAVNGFTEQEVTAFHITTRGDQWRFALDWLAQHVLEPAFDETDVAAEQRIVCEELDLRNPHAGSVTFESVLYPDQPLGRDIGGDKGTVRSVSLEDLKRFYSEHYRASNVAVAFAGRVPRAEVAAAIRERFASLPPGEVALAREPARPRSDRLTFGGRDEFEISGSVMLGYHLPAGGARDLAIQMVIERYLRDRFFDEVREARQLSYAPHVELVHYSDTHRLQFETHVSDEGNLPEVVELCDALVAELQHPDRARLERARLGLGDAFVANSASDLADVAQLAWLIRRGGQSPAELGTEIAKLDEAAIADYAAHNLTEAKRFSISDSALVGSGASMWWIAGVALLFLAFVDGMRGFVIFHAAKDFWSEWKQQRQRARRAEAKPSKKKSSPKPARDPIVPGDVGELERSFQRYFEEQDPK